MAKCLKEALRAHASRAEKAMQVGDRSASKKAREPREYDNTHAYLMASFKSMGYRTWSLKKHDSWIDRGGDEAYKRGEIPKLPFDMPDSDSDDPKPENPGNGAEGDEGGEPKRAKTTPLKIRLGRIDPRSGAVTFHVWPGKDGKDGEKADYDSLGDAMRALATHNFVTNKMALKRSLASVGSVDGHKPISKLVQFWVFGAAAEAN